MSTKRKKVPRGAALFTGVAGRGPNGKKMRCVVRDRTGLARTGTVFARVQNLFARPGLFIGVVAVSLGAAKTPGWGSKARSLVGLSISALLLLVVTVAFLLERGLGGVGQRLIFILLYSWAVLVSWHLIGVNQPARGSA